MARRIRTIEYNGNIYLTSNRGIIKLEDPYLSLIYAGLPRGLDLTLAVNGVAGFLPNNTSVSYRLIWGIKDTNGNYIYGPPSSRNVITNTAGATRNVAITFLIPASITTDHFFQIYRSYQVSSTPSFIDPGDELFLVYERNPTAGEIAARAVTGTAVIDLTAQSIIGPPLYTNATQEGIRNENTRPPLATDIALYRDHVVYANTAVPQRFTINMVGTTGMIGNTITIAGVVYTGAVAENIAAAQFFVDVASPTPSIQIDNTARSLCRVINGVAANTRVYAYYISGFSETPGRIFIESRVLGDTAWYVLVNNATMSALWSPQLPTAQNENYRSTNDQRKNQLIVSKFQQPEHAPYINSFLVGARDEEIQRVVALRDSLLIFKDNSIWRMSGSSLANFQISLLDNTVSLVSRDSVSVVNNLAFALTNQGVIAVSDNGVQIVSMPIEYDLLSSVRIVINEGLDHEQIGQGHESERFYLCSIDDQNLSKTICYVYNLTNQAWTRWLIHPSCMNVFKDSLYYGFGNNPGYIFNQRFEDYASTGGHQLAYCDPQGTFNYTAINVAENSLTGTFTDSVDWNGYYPNAMERGWCLVDGLTKYYVIRWDIGASKVFLNTVAGLAAPPRNLVAYRPIKQNVMFAPRVVDDLFELKQFNELLLDLATIDIYEFDVAFYNNLDTQVWPIATDFNPVANRSKVITPGVFASTLAGTYVPYNIFRTDVSKIRAGGPFLIVQVQNQTAYALFQIRGFGVTVHTTNSVRVTR